MGDRSSTIPSNLARRAFLQLSVAGSGAFGVRELFAAEPQANVETALRQTAPARAPGPTFGVPYAGDRLNRIAFPLGGLGAGMVCLEGTGAFSHVSLRHQPDVFNSRSMFAALGVKGHPELARVLEAPVPEWKLFGGPDTANGAGGTSYGLPRLASGTFLARFPFAMAVMRDRRPPLEVTLTGWSPFVPNDPDGSSLPVAGLEYRIVNRGRTPARCRVLVPRPQLHGRARQAAGGAARSTAASCCGAAPTRTSRGRTAASPSSSTSRARPSTTPGSAAAGGIR